MVSYFIADRSAPVFSHDEMLSMVSRSRGRDSTKLSLSPDAEEALKLPLQVQERSQEAPRAESRSAYCRRPQQGLQDLRPGEWNTPER